MGDYAADEQSVSREAVEFSADAYLEAWEG